MVDNALYTFGGDTEENFNKVSYKLAYEQGSWVWSTWGEISFPRWLVAAMEVPDEIVTCEQ